MHNQVKTFLQLLQNPLFELTNICCRQEYEADTIFRVHSLLYRLETRWREGRYPNQGMYLKELYDSAYNSYYFSCVAFSKQF